MKEVFLSANATQNAGFWTESWPEPWLSHLWNRQKFQVPIPIKLESVYTLKDSRIISRQTKFVLRNFSLGKQQIEMGDLIKLKNHKI